MNKNSFFLFIILVIAASCQPIPNYEIVIENIALFDGIENQGNVNIAINRDTIAAINSNNLHGDKIIDGSGKYIIPGLVNAHVHVQKPDHLEEAFKAGVLTVFNLNQAWPIDDELRAYSDSMGYSNYHSAGSGASVKGGHPSIYVPHPENYPFISDSISAPEFVRIAKLQGSEVIKITFQPTHIRNPNIPLTSLSYEQIEELINAARLANLLSIVHTRTLTGMLKIAEYQPDGFAHFWKDTRKVTPQNIMKLKNSGAFIIPTLMIHGKLNEIIDGDTSSIGNQGFDERAYVLTDAMLRQKFSEVFGAGIPIIAGTDPPTLGVNYGYDLIEELKIYEKSGVPLTEVLKTATGNASKYLPINGNGSIKVGGPATFLILNDNPLMDISALDQIEQIWKNGMRSK